MIDSKDPDNEGNPLEEPDITRALNPAAYKLGVDLEAAKATDAVLIVIRGTPQGKKYSLKGQSTFLLGRDKAVEIHIDDANISPGTLSSHSRAVRRSSKTWARVTGRS